MGTKGSRRVGFARVSTTYQDEIRQVLALKKENVDEIIIDKNSGSQIGENLNNLLESLVAGDTLVILSIDRIGRRLDQNLAVIAGLMEKKVTVIFLKEGLRFNGDDSDYMSKFTLYMLSVFSEMERDFTRDRARAGIEARKARLGKSYNAQSRRRISLMRNRRFHSDMKLRTREFVMGRYNLGQSTYYRYRKAVLAKK